MNFKKLLVFLAAAMLLVSLSVTSFATGDSDETAPTAAQDWKDARLEQLKARLETLVADGTITQEQADTFLARVSQCMESCDGSGCTNRGECSSTGCGNQGQCGRNACNGRRAGQGCGRYR